MINSNGRKKGQLIVVVAISQDSLNRKATHNQNTSSLNMSEYRPKISERLADELIEIANSSTEFWQQDAINQAKIELIKRNVTEKDQDDFFDQKAEEKEEYFKNEELKRQSNEIEKYNSFEMILILSIAPFIITDQWRILRQLKQENYILKFKQRIILLTLGMMIWVGCFYFEFDKWQKERFNEESRY